MSKIQILSVSILLNKIFIKISVLIFTMSIFIILNDKIGDV